MKRYRGSSLKIDWQDDELMEKMYKLADKVTLQMGNVALETAKKLVPVDTGELQSQIDLKISKFEGGGVAIVAQGPEHKDPNDKYWFHATFVELGTHTTRNQAAQPYLRPAIKKVRRIFKRAVQDAINE